MHAFEGVIRGHVDVSVLDGVHHLHTP
jgi:hypothetical protein